MGQKGVGHHDSVIKNHENANKSQYQKIAEKWDKKGWANMTKDQKCIW